MTAGKTPRADTRFRRLREKGSKDFELACSIIDDARVGHVGIVVDEVPYVIPMALARDGKNVLLHGSRLSRLMKCLAEGSFCCLTVTHLDGLVLARSAFNSSMNYRTVMVFGSASAVTDPDEKIRGLDLLTDHLLPGRRDDLREPTRKELNATLLVRLPIERFSVKVSDGPPDDPVADRDAPIWAGVVPLTLEPGEPIPAPDMKKGVALPKYLRKS